MATEQKSPQRKKHLETISDHFTAGFDFLGQRRTGVKHRLTCLQRALGLGLGLLATVCAAQSLPSAQGTTSAQQQFHDVAAKLRAFPPDSKFYAGASFPSDLNMDIRYGWPVTTGLAEYRVLMAGDYPVPFLLSLLKDTNPRVRTLAAAALVAKGDMRLQYDLAPLVHDESPTFDQIVSPATNNYMPPFYLQQTVSTAVLHLLRMSSVKDFDQYWSIHAGRDHSAGWFLLQFQRPGHAATAREDIQRLPSPDRELTILWIGSGRYQYRDRLYPGYSDEELLDAARKLGRDNVLATLRGEAPTTDPDIFKLPVSYEVTYDHQYAMGRFLLAHAKDLLKPSDADELLRLEIAEKSRVNLKHPDYSEWWSIAVANLRPKDADAILDAAEIRWPYASHVELTRWDLQGQGALPKILAHFYSSPAAEKALPMAIGDANPSNAYQPLVEAILASEGHLHIGSEAMQGFGSLGRIWHTNYDREMVDWVYAQPPDPNFAIMSPPRADVVRAHGVARKLILDPRFDQADGQLLYVIQQNCLDELTLDRTRSARLGQLIMQLYTQYPRSEPEPILEETRALLREGVRVQ